ncbi:MAG: EscU/YscU/HrcU family type III secretion system export apparatus switch protein, partial [Planctomycetota bacterium]|nr:EscU/YscU/HrcU family type III secretion system export apparatus switch protein [Planctomycetota bacterium]
WIEPLTFFPCNSSPVHQVGVFIFSLASSNEEPICAAPTLALSHVSQIGILFSPKSLAPKIEKLNPIKGFQRIYGVAGLVKVSLDFGKVVIVVIVVSLSFTQYHEQIIVLPYLEPLAGFALVGKMMFDVALKVLAVLLSLGVLDLLFQRWKHRKDMKMTKQQVKDEMKQTEGDPDVKRRRMRIQQQIAMQRISTAVPKADVIVTNPEHISIAIQYDHGEMHAPKVVAKGADHLALRIRQIAIQHKIPIVERKPLARAMYRNVKVGQEVPPEYYKAVAEILAYVYRLSGRMAG